MRDSCFLLNDPLYTIPLSPFKFPKIIFSYHELIYAFRTLSSVHVPHFQVMISKGVECSDSTINGILERSMLSERDA